MVNPGPVLRAPLMAAAPRPRRRVHPTGLPHRRAGSVIRRPDSTIPETPGIPRQTYRPDVNNGCLPVDNTVSVPVCRFLHRGRLVGDQPELPGPVGRSPPCLYLRKRWWNRSVDRLVGGNGAGCTQAVDNTQAVENMWTTTAGTVDDPVDRPVDKPSG